jgi:flagellar basal-body rod modification protein FlgD
MDVRHMNSNTGVGSAASAAVANSLAPRRAITNTAGTPKPAAAAGSASSTADPSDITSSDFLTLLVSELQNQDPTQPADPNAYISQLVGVNSLQQLIQINQGVGSLDTAATSAVSGSNSSESNSDAVTNANTVTSTNSISGTQSASGQNSIWGGTTSS